VVTNGDGDERLGATVEGARRARRRDRGDCLLAGDTDVVDRFDDAAATVVSVGAGGGGIAGLCRRRAIADGRRGLAGARLAGEGEPSR
jgi:hypothetical protein